MLLYLFCAGNTADNLLGMFQLFDKDGNGTISIEELLDMMAFFIEIGIN
jgi:Ca2+-binding EF-hand superfamily protein